ncbi:hypothetical protein HHI36_021216 [Cryptolaemus montrouzieri]|uniref:Regulator of microtubule dynamics protein 1 n=1 Tax=Cryptolaemus montrouzieri TaxID=559131 RepID=A0ABD2MW40_9CUCU
MEGLADIDNKLNTSTDLDECLKKLTDLNSEYPENPQLLWRIGKCHHKIEKSLKDDKLKREHIDKGIEACEASLKLDQNQADAHKWMAVLVGSRSGTQPIKARILDGQKFKKHVDIAISINPNDALLRHLVGRFCFEVSGVNWFERKVAATLYADPPKSTYDEALGHFLEAERLIEIEWKENRLYIAKCYIALNKYKEALEWLDKAESAKGESEDPKINEDVKALLAKYAKYR